MSFDIALLDPGAVFSLSFGSGAGELAAGAIANAKEDTVLLLVDGVLDADVSQFESSPIPTATGAYQDPAPLRALDGSTGREIWVRFAWDEADCVVLSHGDPADATFTSYTIGSAGGEIFFGAGDGSLDVIATIKSLAACDLGLLWVTRPNPDTTGAADALISTIAAYNFDTGTWVSISQYTHEDLDTDAGYTLSVGGLWDGVSLTQPSGLVQEVRISRAGDHSTVEAHEDFVAQRTAPPADLSPIALVVGPAPSSSGLGDAGEFAGAQNMGLVARHSVALRRRLWQPLVNEAYWDAYRWSEATEPAQWIRTPPDADAAWRMRLCKLRWVAIPVGCNAATVRVHVVSYVEAGGSVPLRIRCYAFNHRPGLSYAEEPNKPTFAHAFAQSDTLDTDHTASGTGEWLEWGGDPTATLKLPTWVDPGNPKYHQTTHLCLAYWFDDADPNVANARVIVKAWHVRPTVVQLGGGLGA